MRGELREGIVGYSELMGGGGLEEFPPTTHLSGRESLMDGNVGVWKN